MNYKEMFIQEEAGLHGKTEYRVHRIKEKKRMEKMILRLGHMRIEKQQLVI